MNKENTPEHKEKSLTVRMGSPITYGSRRYVAGELVELPEGFALQLIEERRAYPAK